MARPFFQPTQQGGDPQGKSPLAIIRSSSPIGKTRDTLIHPRQHSVVESWGAEKKTNPPPAVSQLSALSAFRLRHLNDLECRGARSQQVGVLSKAKNSLIVVRTDGSLVTQGVYTESGNELILYHS